MELRQLILEKAIAEWWLDWEDGWSFQLVEMRTAISKGHRYCWCLRCEFELSRCDT